jgi:hypothetical protein
MDVTQSTSPAIHHLGSRGGAFIFALPATRNEHWGCTPSREYEGWPQIGQSGRTGVTIFGLEIFIDQHLERAIATLLCAAELNEPYGPAVERRCGDR